MALRWNGTPAWLSFLNREGPALPDDSGPPRAESPGLVAELYEAAYDFALRHGFSCTFIEVQVGLLDALRARAGRDHLAR